MGNVFTYLNWRGDLTFQERPFCQVDNLVLALGSLILLYGVAGPVHTLYQSGKRNTAAAR